MSKILLAFALAAVSLFSQTTPIAILSSDRVISNLVPKLNTNFNNLFMYQRQGSLLPSTCGAVSSTVEFFILTSTSPAVQYQCSSSAPNTWSIVRPFCTGSNGQIIFNSSTGCVGSSDLMYDDAAKLISGNANLRINGPQGLGLTSLFGPPLPAGVTINPINGRVLTLQAYTSSQSSLGGTANPLFAAGFWTGTAAASTTGVNGGSFWAVADVTGTGGIIGHDVFPGTSGSSAPGIGAADGHVNINSTGTFSNVGGFTSTINFNSASGGTTSAYNFAASGPRTTAGYTVTNYFGMVFTERGQSLGTITNRYGIYMEPFVQALGTLKYSIYIAGNDAAYFGGGVQMPAYTPASSSDTCTTGQLAWDSSFIYTCVATNTWKRSATATW